MSAAVVVDEDDDVLVADGADVDVIWRTNDDLRLVVVVELDLRNVSRVRSKQRSNLPVHSLASRPDESFPNVVANCT